MALIKESDGTYIKVININYPDKTVTIEAYKNEAIRNDATVWDVVNTIEHYLATDFDNGFDAIGDPEKSIMDNGITAAYNALKITVYPEPEYINSI